MISVMNKDIGKKGIRYMDIRFTFHRNLFQFFLPYTLIPLYLYTLVLLIIFPTDLSSQVGSEAQFNYAKTLFDKGEYFDAVTEFKRLLFFDKFEQYSFSANKMIGLSYKQGAKLSDAIRYLTLAEIHAPTADDIYDCRIETIKIYILRRTTSKALFLLDSISNDSRFSSDINEINYWKGWAYIFSDDWEKASQSFALVDSNHFLKTFCDSVDIDLYNVTLAKVISLVPGLGQFYTGEYISGLISIS